MTARPGAGRDGQVLTDDDPQGLADAQAHEFDPKSPNRSQRSDDPGWSAARLRWAPGQGGKRESHSGRRSSRVLVDERGGICGKGRGPFGKWESGLLARMGHS